MCSIIIKTTELVYSRDYLKTIVQEVLLSSHSKVGMGPQADHAKFHSLIIQNNKEASNVDDRKLRNAMGWVQRQSSRHVGRARSKKKHRLEF